MESSAQPLADLQLAVVGDPEGVLTEALERLGARAVAAGLHELGKLAGSHLVLVGKAAVDGGKHALGHASDGSAATVVLPRGAASARIAACSLGARVVEAAEPEQLARAVLASLEGPPTRELGWTDLGSLLDALGERVALQLGAEHSRGMQLRLGDAEEVAALLERTAKALGETCLQTRRPDALGPAIAVAELSWDDDPQTQRLEDEEVARWRRLSARDEGAAKMIRGLAKARDQDSGEWGKGDSEPPVRVDHIRSDVVAATGPQVRLPAPGRLPSGVIPHDDDPPTRPAALPLVRRHDYDIDETAPRRAVDDEDAPFDEPPPSGDFDNDEDTSIHESAALPGLSSSPSERATVPERPPLVAEPPREATPPPVAPSQPALTASPRPSKLPLIFGLGVIVLGTGVAIAGAGYFAFGGADAVGAVAATQPVTRPEVMEEAEPRRAPAVVTPTTPEAPVVGAPEARAADEGGEVDADEPVAPSIEEAPEGELDEAALRERSDARVADGQAAEREGDWGAARAAYLAALAIYEPNPHANAGMARERLQMEDAETALTYAERAAALRRRRAEYQVLIGRAHRLAGDANAARAAFDRALELDPDDRAALRALSQ
ncbi:MAG: hypothetical protein H6719_22965 [Sandaracinaceae bacterium]|nr:hypothetical protein [Sandaracinaceae bacterium]